MIKNENKKLSIKDIAVLSVFGVVIFISKILLEFLPNFHLIAILIITLTVVYRAKALISIYVFVFLLVYINGLSLWTIPHFYIWLFPFVLTMLLPRNIPNKISAICWTVIAVLHGLLYGTLYAPFQAFAFGLDFDATIAWIITGLPWDLVHGISNGLLSLLILPLVKLLKKIT